MAYKKPRVLMKPGQIKVHMDDGTTQNFSWPKPQATISEIKQKLGIPSDKMVIEKQANGTKKYSNSDKVDLTKGVELAVQPNVIQGAAWNRGTGAQKNLEQFDYRRDRRAAYLISQLLDYGEEKYRRDKVTIQLTKDLKYVYIPDFPLPAIWKQRRVPILIYIPESYPDTPPIGFYVPHGTCLQNGQRHNHQFTAGMLSQPDLQSLGWDWFCLHLENRTDWQPKDNPLKPHNFWSYINIIRLGLTYAELRNA